MRYVLVIFLLFITDYGYAQRGNKSFKIDSLKHHLDSVPADSGKVKLLIEIADQYSCTNVKASIDATAKALSLAEDIHWTRGQMLAYMSFGRIYWNCNSDYVECRKYFTLSAKIAKEIGDNINEANTYNSIGLSYHLADKYDSALYYYRKSLELNNSPGFQLTPLANSGLVYNKLGDYKKALECYEQALKLTHYLLISSNAGKNDSMSLVGLLLTIGDIYVSTAQYDKALGNYREALAISHTLNSRLMIIWALTEMGKAYTNMHDVDMAIRSFNEALAVSDSAKENDFKSIVLNEIGNIYLGKGDPDKALEYAQRSLAISIEYKNTQQLPKTYTTLGKIDTRLKKYDAAVRYLSEALAIGNKIGAIDDQKDTWEAMSVTYAAMNQPAKAFDAYKNYIVLRDSVYNVAKAKELVRVDMQAAFSRQQLADSIKQDDAKKVLNLKLQKQRAYTYGGFAGLLLVLALSFFIYRNYSQQKKANKVIGKANATIQKEKQVSETLLLNILPEDVALELKTEGKVHAKLYDDVTVLFTDFVNFTVAGERLTPQKLVEELDACFMAFDEIISKYNIEKIKTVGDAYLAVSGLPKSNPDHAVDMVAAALEIRDFMIDRQRQLGENTFGIRLGLHSGSVVAGVVGLKKFAYDIWGDTVNTASRMEQNSEPGKVNISEATYDLLKGKYNCVYRGKIEAKNKGVIDMYFVNG